jgi:flagellar assembly protein FliH
MENSPLSPENVSSLIDHVMKSKDPANVGLRKILKKKEDEARSFQLHAPQLTEFETPGVKARHLSEDDTIILELEKKVNELQIKLKQLEDKAVTAEKDAFVKGRNEGFTHGVKKGSDETAAKYEQQISALQEKVTGFIATFERSRHEQFENIDHILLKLVFEIAKKVINSEVKNNREHVLSVIKKAIYYIGDKERLVVRVAPRDFEIVSERKDFWLPVTERVNNIVIENDDRITQGGCVIESNSGTVDARLGVQFKELENLVEKIWENLSAPQQSDNKPDSR